MKNVPIYSFFLFSKLYSIIIKVDDYAYDVLFEDILSWYDKYNKSWYNDENKPEYECMVAYLEDNKEAVTNLAELSASKC